MLIPEAGAVIDLLLSVFRLNRRAAHLKYGFSLFNASPVLKRSFRNRLRKRVWTKIILIEILALVIDIIPEVGGLLTGIIRQNARIAHWVEEETKWQVGENAYGDELKEEEERQRESTKKRRRV